MARRRVCNTCGRLPPTKKYLGTDIFVWFKVCVKDATGVEFLCSSLRLFQSLIVEGRKELKYWFVRALIVEIVFAFLRLCRDVLLTVGGVREDKERGVR